MLIKRIITAAILMPLVIISVFYLPPMIFDLLVLIVVLLAAWEFSSLFNWSQKKRVWFLVALGLFALFIGSLYFFSMSRLMAVIIVSVVLALLFLACTLWGLIVPYFLWRYLKIGNSHSIGSSVFLGTLIFIPCWVGMIILAHHVGGTPFLCLLLAIVWAADIGAYFAGKFFGKHLLAPKISPQKTIEGVCGGILASLLVTVIFIFLNFDKGLTVKLSKIPSLLILSAVVSIWSVIGDLFESMLKRQAGVKDSGKLLPGHGGMYDRIDGLIAAAPIFVMGILLLDLIG